MADAARHFNEGSDRHTVLFRARSSPLSKEVRPALAGTIGGPNLT
jgi:hypothetical protein